VWVTALTTSSHRKSSVNNKTVSNVSVVEAAFMSAWYGKKLWAWLLLPLSFVYWAISRIRRAYLIRFRQVKLAVPVVVVGNITLGGTGKTPLLISLVKYLQSKNLTPGVISRGYGGLAPHYPYLLEAVSTAREAGDEPLSIYQQTGCLVCVGKDRIAAGEVLIQAGCNVLISDDGLQHYRLARDIEIVVIDGQRGLGNGMCLPAGPLREMPSRLGAVDFIVLNSPQPWVLNHFEKFAPNLMQIIPNRIVNLVSGEAVSSEFFSSQVIEAVAGIGNPERFSTTLEGMGINANLHTFKDHYSYTESDFLFLKNKTVLMTEKDAVKCKDFADPLWFYVEISAELPQEFWNNFTASLKLNN
jgi:tetraacyldisaccharide 4'-kinase